VSASSEVNVIIPDRVIPRLIRRLPASEVAANRGIPIVEFDGGNGQSGLSTEVFLPIAELQRHFNSVPKTHAKSLELLWHLTLFSK